MLVDQAVITVEAGSGGNGCLSFRREKYIPRGGPNGGNGGHGGDVLLVASNDVRTLVDFSYQPIYRARHGGHGLGKDQFGRNAEPVTVKVPVGTVVLDEAGDTLVDLSAEGQVWRAARGGRGGRGNASFSTATRQSPKLAEKGEPGEKKILHLELKLLADVGLVGFPNAGKSTLLSRVTSARPKIADYPFTTLEPQLGVVRLPGERTFVIADVPGILEGASEGKGLGLQFLRHLERTRVILHLVEAPEASTQRELEKRVRVIENELAEYPAGLDRLPRILVLTKIDACADRARLDRWSAALRKKGHEVHAISAVSGVGLDALVEAAWRRIVEKPSAGEPEVPLEEHKVYKPEPRFTIEGQDGLFEVDGPEIRKWVAMTDFRNLRAVERFHLILGRMGVLAALKKRGLKAGDKVRCGEQELHWEDGKTKV